MLRNLVFLFVSLFLIQSSLAAPSCFEIHLPKDQKEQTLDAQEENFLVKLTDGKIEPVQVAAILDYLNLKFNKFMFSDSVMDRMDPKTSDLAFASRTKARYQAFKLKRILKELTDTSTEKYELDNLAKRLVDLTFLSDPTVTKEMSFNDKKLYRQAQMSIIRNGLERFLFNDKPVPPTLKRKIFNLVLVPFKQQYFRWTMAFIYMPKLNGIVMPYELAAKIAWYGLDANRDALKPYVKTILGKSYFNVFSSVYNWSLVTALFVGLPTYGVYKWDQWSEEGFQKVRPALEQMHQNSNEMATPGYADKKAEEIAYKLFADGFEVNHKRKPNATEQQLMHDIVRERMAAQNGQR